MTENRPPRRRWPVIVLAAPAFVAVWSGWVGLGQLTGFGLVHPLPGIADGFTINSAITLPVGVETYAAYALSVWLSGEVPAAARRFARWSALGSLILGALGQVAFHLLVAAGVRSAPWQITTVVSCFPVAVLGMGAALAHLLRAETAGVDRSGTGTTSPAPVPEPVAVPDSEPDTAAAPEHDTSPTPKPARNPTRRAAKNTTAATTPKTPATADRVAKLRAKDPDITQAAVAAKLKVSDRTVQRYWGPDTEHDTAPAINNVVPLLEGAGT